MQLRQVLWEVVLIEDFQVFHGVKRLLSGFLLAELTLLVNGDVLRPMSLPSPKPISMTVSFDDADGEGIVFFGNYFRLAHRALEQHLPLLGIPWKEWFANKDWGVPLRHVEADYLQPLRPGDHFQVVVKIEELGESSVHFAFDFLDHSGKLAASVKTSHVFVGRSTFKKVPMPSAVREILAAAQAR